MTFWLCCSFWVAFWISSYWIPLSFCLCVWICFTVNKKSLREEPSHRRCAPSHLDLVRERLFRSRDRFWYGLLERLLFLELERRLDLLLLRLRSDECFILNLQQISTPPSQIGALTCIVNASRNSSSWIWTWSGTACAFYCLCLQTVKKRETFVRSCCERDKV